MSHQTHDNDKPGIAAQKRKNMVLKMFTIRDSKAETYSHVLCRSTIGLMERELQELVNSPETPYGKHPEDYDLYYIGDYDDQTGKMTQTDTPQHMVKCTNLVQSKQ